MAARGWPSSVEHQRRAGAPRCAAALTRLVDDVTTLDLFAVRLRVFDGARFREREGSAVPADAHFRPDEISWLVGFALGP